MRKSTLLALASLSAGVTVVAAPAAHASAAEPAGHLNALRATSDPASAAAPVCWSWTDFGNADGHVIRLPSTTRNGAQADCQLASGHSTDGVYKLQDALNKCYGKNLEFDGIYGPATEKAVKEVQFKHEIDDDGVYGPDTRRAMWWPRYTQNNVFVECRD